MMHGVCSVGIVIVEFTADLASGLRCPQPTILCVRTVIDVFCLKVRG